MPSNKSTPAAARQAVAPQRQHGKQRVAELLEASKHVIAEKGFAAATMAEIAAIAGAPIGSLYRFFPNKEAIADALIRDFLAILEEAFGKLAAQAAELPAAALADALLDLMIHLHGQGKAIFALVESHAGWSARRGEFRARNREHIAHTLMLHRPGLAPGTAADIAVVLLQNMKMMAGFVHDPSSGASPGACEELRVMTRQYLVHRLAG